jgi:hypothetical protein
MYNRYVDGLTTWAPSDPAIARMAEGLKKAMCPPPIDRR